MTETRWQVPLSDVVVDDELVEAVLEVVRSGWWSMGPRVEQFESDFGTIRQEVRDELDRRLPEPTP